jgi:hypothetical protein
MKTLRREDEMTEDEQAILALALYLSDLMTEVARQFEDPVEVSLVVRNPKYPDGSLDVFMSNDSPETVVEAIRAVHSREDGIRILRDGE